MIPADHAARQTALDLQRQLCVRAPAGSGKTGLLICRMLAALGSVDQPEQVLAITFTRKAAAEIRDRLFAALDAASGPCPADDFGATLHGLAAAVCARSARLGWDLPQNPQRIRASTIDSLNRDLARQMPVLSGLGGHIQPRDDAGELYRAALLTVLGRIEDPTLDPQERDSLGRVLRLARNRLDDLLAALAPLLAQREQWVRSALDAETAAVEQRARAHLDELIQASLEQVNRALPKPPRQAWLVLLQQLAAQGVAPWQPLQGQAQWPGTSQADLPTWQILASSLLTNSNDWRKPGGLKSTTGFPAGAAMQEAKRVLPEFVHAGETVRAQLALLRLLPAQLPREDLQLASDLLRVLREALLQLTLDFAQHGHCDHTQLALAARQALADPGSPAAARADARLRHILVDEMQDTSAGQIALLEALVRDWQPGDGRSLFLVGDPQQSIYLFRQARVERFHALLQPGAQLGPVTLQPLQLSHNFRSDPALVHWTNATMAQVFMARGSPIPFAPSATTTPDGEPPAGAANLPREGSTAALATPAVQLWSPADPAAEARLALEHLREIREACPGAHIGVLARNRRHLQPLARMLRESGLPFAGVELEALQDTAVIRDYLSIVRVLHQAEDDVASLRLLRIPGVGLSWAQCDELVVLWPDARWAQRLRQALPTAADPDLRRRLEGLQLALQAAEHNLARFGELPRASRLFFHAVHRPAGLHASERRDVQRFEQFLRSHCPSGMLEDEAAFARGLQKLWADSDADALELMTVHKSKGLEFDHVLLLGLGRSGRGGDEPLLRWHAQYGAGLLAVRPPPSPRGSSPPQLYRWLSEQQKEAEAAERLRLLYVAVTRARHGVHLYLTGRGDHDSL
ncbi:MAG: UvrD-helicase domain-containing protein, partial [Oceanococcaceae bacterium]